jgi:hypothetical protein
MALTYSVPPLVRHSITIRHLGKNRGPEFDTFSPGTEYHFARNSFFPKVWRLRPHHFFPVVNSTPVLLQVTNKYYWCWIGVVDLPWDRHSYQLPINHQHTNYMKLYVHCAFEEGFVGLHFVFDGLTTDNSTGIRQKWKQSVPRYSTNLRCIIWVGSPENRQWKHIWLLRIRRRIRVDPWPWGVQNSRWPLH